MATQHFSDSESQNSEDEKIINIQIASMNVPPEPSLDSSSSISRKGSNASECDSKISDEFRNDLPETEISEGKNLLGIFFVICAAFGYTFYTLVCKYLLTYRLVPYTQLAIIRSTVTWWLTFSWLWWLKYRKDGLLFFGEPSQRIWLFLRSIFLFGGNFLWMWSLVWLTPGDADTIWEVQAFWVLIGAHFLLNEKMDSISISCVLVGLAGVVLVTQPSFLFEYQHYTNEKWRDVGIFLVLASSLSSASCVLVTRAVGINVNWLQFEFATATLATFVFIPLVIIIFFVYQWLNLGSVSKAVPYIWNNDIASSDWGLCVSLGLIGLFSTGTLTRGIQLTPARIVSIILYTEIPLAYFGQLIAYDISPNIYTWMGAALVFFGALVLSIRSVIAFGKHRSHISKNHNENPIPASLSNPQASMEKEKIGKIIHLNDDKLQEITPLLKKK